MATISSVEIKLVERFGLRRALVVPAPMAEMDVRAFLAAAAGAYVSEALPPAGSLGITWGGTINAAAQNIKRRTRDESRVVLLCGGLAQSTHVNPFDNAAMMARGARRDVLLRHRSDVCGNTGAPGCARCQCAGLCHVLITDEDAARELIA